jgi:hypothetical protein
MKKILILLVAIFFAFASMSAKKTTSRDKSVLPVAAQTVLNNNFSKTKVNHINIESGSFGKKEYDVILNNGTEIEFDKDGKWTEIDCGSNKVPDNLIMLPIRNYVNKNYKGTKIVKIERNSKGYEVELSNGLELKFAQNGDFLKID